MQESLIFNFWTSFGRVTKNKPNYLAQILSAIECLHAMAIVCADLKPKNILIDCVSLERIRLTYFFSSSCVDTEICKEAVAGCYVAPGILEIQNFIFIKNFRVFLNLN